MRHLSDQDLIENSELRFGAKIQFETDWGNHREVKFPTLKEREAREAAPFDHAAQAAYDREVSTPKGELAHVALLESLFQDDSDPNLVSDGEGGLVELTEEQKRDRGVAEAEALGIDSEGAWDNSVAYVQGWVKKLSDEPQAIISAAQEAQKRLDLIFPKATEGGEVEEPEAAVAN